MNNENLHFLSALLFIALVIITSIFVIQNIELKNSSFKTTCIETETKVVCETCYIEAGVCKVTINNAPAFVRPEQ